MHACDGDLSVALARHDAEAGSTAILLWAETVADRAAAEALISKIEALDDPRYDALLRGELALDAI